MYNLFLSTADAATTEGGGMWSLLSTLPMILIMVLFGYFLLYRPQKKQERAINDMRNSLRVGDEIATNGGILGTIIQIKEDFIIIETGSNKTKMKIAKWGIRSVEHREEDDDEEDGDEE